MNTTTRWLLTTVMTVLSLLAFATPILAPRMERERGRSGNDQQS